MSGENGKHPGGRPPFFETPEEMEALIEEYIKQNTDENKRLTITGLALHLGFCDRDSIYYYEKKPEFYHIIKRGKLLIENGYENNLHGTVPTGSIFALKNMGWKDSQDVNLNADIKNTNISIEELESHINSDEPRKT